MVLKLLMDNSVVRIIGPQVIYESSQANTI